MGGMLAGGSLWREYSARFVDPSGRVIDTGNGGISHSEGQGYGMLIAVAAGDRAGFDRMWAWTRAELGVRYDHLFGWKWDPARSRVVDANDASDGDLLIAWALAEAAAYWNDSGYLVDATKIVADIESKLIRRYASPGAVLLPAVTGFSENERPDGPVVNLSYWIFPALARLAQLDGRPEWADLTKTGLGLIETARFGSARLPVGWTSIGREAPALARGHKIRFGYNAIRIPLYMYWSGLTSQSIFRDLVDAWESGPGGVRVIGGEGAVVDQPLAEQGYGAIAALARCAANGQPFPADFYKPRVNENYFPTTLHIMAIMAAISRGGRCLDGAAAAALTGPGWVARPAVPIAYGAPPRTVAPAPALEQPSLALSPVARPASDAPALTTASSMGDTLGLVTLFIVLLSGSIGVAKWLGDKDEQDKEPPPEIDPRPVIASGAAPVAMAHRVRLAPSVPPVSPPAPRVAAALPAMPPPVTPKIETVVDEFRSPPTTRQVELKFDDPLFLRKLETAMAISGRFGRTVALAAFRVEGYANVERRHGRPDADAMMTAFASGLGSALGVGGCLSIQEGGLVFICLAFVARDSDLETVVEPLMEKAGSLADAHPAHGEIRAGVAFWPVDGDKAEELVAAAHRRCLSAGPRARLAISA